MRAQCSVCQELFGEQDVIMAPQCGHTFHNNCITQWLGTKKSCPTCRQTTAANKLIRIFFDIAFAAEVDSVDLQQKMDEMSLKFQEGQLKLNKLSQDYLDLRKKSSKISKEKKEVDQKFRDSEITVNNLQQRLEFLNKQVRNFNAVEEDLRSCKEQLKLLESVKLIVNSSYQEVQEMLEQYGDHSETAKSLSTQCVILSRELNAKASEKQKTVDELRKCKRHLTASMVELKKVTKELKEKEEYVALAEEDIKRYSLENAKLQDKLKVLTDSISSPSGDPRNSALSRLLHESPAPTSLRMSNLFALTPSAPNTPLKSKPSNLSTSVFSNVTGMRPKLSNPEQEDIPTTSKSDRQKGARKAETVPSVEPESLKYKKMKIDLVPSSSGFFYDGFGGHSKPDIFPKGSSEVVSPKSSGLIKSGGIKKPRGPVTIKVKGKTQTTTLDYFYSQ